MSRKDGVGCRIAFVLVAAWMGLAGWIQSSPLRAQDLYPTENSGPPYRLYDYWDSPAKTLTFQSINGAIAAAKVGLIKEIGGPRPGCPVVYKLTTYPPSLSEGQVAQVGFTSSCNGAVYGADVGSTKYGYDVGKNAGGCDCDGGNGHNGGPAPGSSLKTHPINTATGNKYEQETDYIAPHDWLTFRRFYNSLANYQPTTLGGLWQHSFDRSLQYLGGSLWNPNAPVGDTLMRSFRPDGRYVLFRKLNGIWSPDADIADTLTEQDNTSGTVTGYALFVAATRQTEQYSAAGLLQSITDQDGKLTTLTYSTSSTPASVAPSVGLLLTVTDPQGRTLNFTYTSTGQLNTVTQPDSGVLTYGYDSSSDLTSVQYPDGKTRQYIYNESALTGGTNLPGSLTGTVDELNTRYESTTYNSNGWATSEYRGAAGAGIDLASVVYGTTNSSTGVTPATLTTPLGAISNLGFQNALGALKVNGSSAPCGDACNQPWSAQTYDANGYAASVTDFNNVTTKTTYDANGLLDQQVDAFGTVNQRTTTTTWNTTLRVPLTQTVQNSNGVTAASTAWVYNARGQATARCDIDPTVSAAASYTCGSAANAPTGVRQTRTTYCDAVDTTQCPLIGLLLTRTGPRTDLTQTTSYTYYLDDTSTHRHGDLKTVTDVLGHVTTLASYDGAGRITRTIDPNSTVTDYTYTPRGWLASRTVRFNPDGSADTYNDATTKISYTAYGAVQTITDADGVKVTYGYDAAHRLTTITDALGNVLQYTLDASGNRTAEKTFAAGSSTPSRTLTRTYNTLGQLTQVVDGLNHTVFDASASGSYDGNGNLLQSSDANGIVHQQSYDALNRLVQSIDNFNGADTATRNTTTTQSWDALDRLTKVTDPSNLTTTYGYDGLSNPISLSSPDSGTSYASFDAAGNMLSRIDANGITVSHSYDALDRRLSDSYADSTLNASYHYDDPDSVVSCSVPNFPANPIGHLTRIVESTVTTTWCYDHNDRPTLQTQLTAGHTDSTEFYFSLAGRLGSRIAPDKVGVFYNYDSAGRVVSVTIPPGTLSNGSSPVQQITYLPFGPMTSYRLGHQIITRSYDANYALTDITSAALNLHFARDPLGNIIAEGNTAGASPAVESYSYDPLNQLKAITQGSTTVESLTYNPAGDRLSKAGGGLATGAYGYDAGTHHLSSIGSFARSNDANGNTTGAIGAGQTWGYGYNGRNRMTVVQANGATVGSYIYNALGQRIQKTTTAPTATTQRYFYDEQSHLIGEYTVGGSNRDTIWLGDMPVATVDTTGSTSVVNFVIGDELGTPRAVVNDAGTTIWSWTYQGNPFGEQQPTSSTGYVLNLRYPGQYYDAESGTNYNLNRTYESATGRYLQSDPLGLNGGISTYAYVGSNPLSNIDPLGLAKQDYTIEPAVVSAEVRAADARLQKLADIAASNVDATCGWRCSLPWIRGTLIHSEFKRLVDSTCPAAQYRTEVSYLEGQIVPYGTAGSSRADVIFGPLNKPLNVYDLKTGWAYLSYGQAKAYGTNLPSLTPFSVIRPDGR
jgi:RHS repeat-associated protein